MYWNWTIAVILAVFGTAIGSLFILMTVELANRERKTGLWIWLGACIGIAIVATACVAFWRTNHDQLLGLLFIIVVPCVVFLASATLLIVVLVLQCKNENSEQPPK